MEIKEILDKLDSKLFPTEIKNELVESFTLAVNSKVAEVTTKLETEYIDKEISLEKKYTKKIENFYESERNHIAGYLNDTKKELTEALVTKYSDEVLVKDALSMYRKMQNFISESASKLNAQPEKELETENLKKQNQKLQEQAISEKKKFDEMSRFSLIKENYEAIKVPQVKEQFEKLAEEISFDGDVKNFNRKLVRVRENLETEYNNILESLKKEVVKETPKDVIKESKEPVVKTKSTTERLKELKESFKSGKKHEIIIEKDLEQSDDINDVSIYSE